MVDRRNTNRRWKSIEDLQKDCFDPYTSSYTVISENHRMIHDGMFFKAQHRETITSSGGTMQVVVAVPALTFPHMQILEITTDGRPLDYIMTEGISTVADGTAVTSFNRNRNANTTASTVVTHTPTTPTGGTQIDEHLIPGIGNKIGIFDETVQGEWVLAPDTKYLIEITNNDTSNHDVEIRLGYYEVGI